MEQSQLVEIIRQLDLEERENVLEFANLTFFNPGRARAPIISLLEACFKVDWESPGATLDKSAVYDAVFPGQVFIAGKLEKVMVEAHRIVRLFLITQHYFQSENEFYQHFDFALVARKRGMIARYQRQMGKLQKMQEATTSKNAAFLHKQFLFEYEKSDYESVLNPAKGDINFPKALEALEQFAHLHRLELLNQLLLQQKIAHFQIPTNISSLIENHTIPHDYLVAYPILEINHQVFQLLKKQTPEPSDARDLFEMLRLHEASLDHKKLLEFYTYLRNICILALTADFENVEMEYLLHDLYKDNLKRGFMHYEGKINRNKYWAIASNAMRVKDFDWAIEFIETYKDEIRNDNETKDIYRLNLANYLFGVGRFSECLDNIPPTSPYTDYLLHAKRIELKTLYELRSDLLSYKLDAFKMFLSRTSRKLLSEVQWRIHQDFANFLFQLSNSVQGDQKRAVLLSNRIREKKQTIEWRWLMEKANALSKH